MTALSAALQAVMAALDCVEARFVIGGSMASSAHGFARQTNDVDIVADLTPESAEDLCRQLTGTFYADAATAREAVRNGRPFNVLSLSGAYKFDIFPAGSDSFAQAQLDGRQYSTGLLPGLEDIDVPLLRPEDTVLAKLRWFQIGGGVSERQWHDVLGVIRVQGSRLDRDYLSRWAARLGLAELLDRASREAQPPNPPST